MGLVNMKATELHGWLILGNLEASNSIQIKHIKISDNAFDQLDERVAQKRLFFVLL